VGGVTFSIEVIVTDGAATAVVSGQPPDGLFNVTGHEDAQQRSLTVTQRDSGGRYVSSATHVHYKEDG
jgi:hypothetical protein